MNNRGMFLSNEIDLIKKIRYPDDLSKISIVLNRSRDGVRKKMNKIGIRVPLNIYMYSDEYSDSIKAYFAGHFDADGCIRMADKSCQSGNKSIQYFPQIEISITSKPTIELYNKYFNGKEYPSRFSKNKKMYTWVTQNINDIYNFVCSVVDFSVEKKEQILLVKEWIEERIKYSWSGKMPEAFCVYTREIADEVKRLKKESSVYELINNNSK